MRLPRHPALLPLLLACVVTFTVLAALIMQGCTSGLDNRILWSIHGLNNAALDQFFLTLTVLGSWAAVIGFGIAVTLVTYRQARRTVLPIILVSVIGSLGINLLLKNMFDRVRPDIWQQLSLEASFSFPSGHAMASATLACVAVYLAWNTRWRLAVTAIALAYILLIGLSRLYLGVHYPTDIIGGWLVATAWVLTVIFVINRVLR